MVKILLKKKTTKKIWAIIILLIMPAFIIWGSGSLIRSKKETRQTGKIFGRTISALELKEAQDAVRNQIIIQLGEDSLKDLEESLQLENLAWERLILLAEAKRRRINATDKEVIELIQSFPFFKRQDKFDHQIYQQILQYVFNTPARVFEEQMRQNIILNKLYKKITEPITLTDREIEEEYRRINEKISVYYLASIPSDFIKEITASEEEIRDYFTKNSLEFKQPPAFNIQYIVLEEEDKDKAQILMRKKIDFKKFAKDLGLEVKETGFFSQTEPIPGIGWAPEILVLLSKAKINEFLPLIALDKNYYLIKLKEKKEADIPELETIKEKVKEVVLKYKANLLAKKRIEECLSELNSLYKNNPNGLDLEALAKKFNLKFGLTNLFTAQDYIEGIGSSEIFWQEAQKLSEESFSEIITMPSGYYIIKIKERVPFDEEKFNQEKQEFSQKLLLLKKQDYYLKFLEELKRKNPRF